MVKSNKKLIFICLIGFLLIGLTSIINVKADSGWDTDYSSSSSSSSSFGGYSDSSSSSSYSRSDRSSSSDRSYSDSESTFFEIFFFIFFFIFIIILMLKKEYEVKNVIKNVNNKQFMPYSDEAFKKNFPDVDIDALRKELGEVFINVQDAWMNIDYEMLRQLVDNELYNSYSMNLNVLETKGQKNIMSDYNIKSLLFCDYQKRDEYTLVSVQLNISFKDYVVDSKNKVIRGKKNRTYLMCYELQFIKYDLDARCPRCGGEIDYNLGRCLSCRTQINRVSGKWLLKTKRLIRQANNI